MFRLGEVLTALTGCALLCACSSSSGGGGGSADGGETILSRTLDLKPDTANVQVNDSIQISAGLVTKSRHADGKIWTDSTPDISLFDWSVVEPAGGTIGPNGYAGGSKLYTAPDTPGEYHVKVVLKSDPSVTDTSLFTVVPQPPCPNDYKAADGTQCTEEGRICAEGCSDHCTGCDSLVCTYGKWMRSYISPDPCSDAGDGGDSDASDADTGDAGTDGP